MQIVFSRPDAVVPYGEWKRGDNMRKTFVLLFCLGLGGF